MVIVLWIIGILAAIFAIGWGVEYSRQPAGTPGGGRVAAANAHGFGALRLVGHLVSWISDRLRGVTLVLLGLFFLSYVFIEGLASAGWQLLLSGLAVLVYGVYRLVD